MNAWRKTPALTGRTSRSARSFAATLRNWSGCSLRTDWRNRRSRRAIERLGARRDGVLRSHLEMLLAKYDGEQA